MRDKTSEEGREKELESELKKERACVQEPASVEGRENVHRRE